MTLRRRRLRLQPRKSRRPFAGHASPMPSNTRRSDQSKWPRSPAKRRAGFLPRRRTRAATPISMPHWRAHYAQGSANTMRGFQGGRPLDLHADRSDQESGDTGADHLRRRGRRLRRAEHVLEEASARRGLCFFPKSGHVLNLEEPALFNEMVERFIALVEAGRWRRADPRSMVG